MGCLFEVVSQRWADKMHPLQYQEPSTVKDGTIARAEKIVAELKNAGSLQRRFAKLADVKSLRMPNTETVEPSAQDRGVCASQEGSGQGLRQNRITDTDAFMGEVRANGVARSGRNRSPDPDGERAVLRTDDGSEPNGAADSPVGP